jgi:hypothetical protein
MSAALVSFHELYSFEFDAAELTAIGVVARVGEIAERASCDPEWLLTGRVPTNSKEAA